MNDIVASNLAFGITEQTIRGLFVRFGAIERVEILTDRKADQPPGVAFIQMSDDEAAERAIAAIDGAELDGRTVHVSAACRQQALPETDQWP